MKKIQLVLSLLLLLAVITIIAIFWWFNKNNKTEIIATPPVETGSAEYLLSGYITTWGVEDRVSALSTTGSETVTFKKQPTKLAWNYSGNWAILRAWAENNQKSITIPAEAKDVTITFKFTKNSKYPNIPGNLQLSVGGKLFTNGRLNTEVATIDWTSYTYQLNYISTQDKPRWADLSSAIGNTLNIKVWIGENKNQIESITIQRIL